jgi:hypothetical protein
MQQKPNILYNRDVGMFYPPGKTGVAPPPLVLSLRERPRLVVWILLTVECRNVAVKPHIGRYGRHPRGESSR